MKAIKDPVRETYGILFRLPITFGYVLTALAYLQ